MQIAPVFYKYEQKHTSGPYGPRHDLNSHVPEIRKLLRETEMSVGQIALQLDVGEATLRAFIKRRQLCDLAWRQRMIKLKNL